MARRNRGSVRTAKYGSLAAKASQRGSCLLNTCSIDAQREMPLVRRADLILLMEDGRITERGTHDDLMAARGVYYEMVLRQMESHGETVEQVLR